MTTQTPNQIFVLPGDEIDKELLPSRPNANAAPLKLGPGLRYLPPDGVVASVAGEVVADGRRGAVWVEGVGGGRVSRFVLCYVVLCCLGVGVGIGLV